MTDFDRERPTPTTAGQQTQHGLRRRQLLATAAGAATLSTAGCTETYDTIVGSETDGDETVTIGVLAPEPENDFNGRAIVRSAQVARDLLNETGGINGRTVELAVGNTSGSPLEARREYQRLVLEEDAAVTIGVSTSEVLETIIDDIAEQETLHITAGAATSSVSELVREDYERYKYHFRAGPVNDYDLGQAQIDFLGDMAPELGWDSIALLAEDYGWNRGAWETFHDEQSAIDLEIAMEERYPPATDDFSTIYETAEAEGADAVFISTAHTGTDAVVDWTAQKRELEFGGIHVPMQLPTYYDAVGGACQFAVGQSSAPLGAEVTAETSSFEDAYQDAYGESSPVYTGYFAYDAVTLFAEAATQAETVDSADLVPVLEDIEFTGSAGQIEFYGQDHEFPHDLAYNRGDTLYFQWQEDDAGNGVQEVIWPDEHATAEYVTPEWL
ncbi:ABC transporter substrate-binding protein [Natrialba asiatica]|uniref:Extracellular ligand-binding receptor n=1 Tax=Natrialba asiatica (strain ATCC 700177 / DSM 12278 / JCM 9576 / FERM P-10747 / NBRC 102637 / 172P1) TaxID=29540 RepID=M0AZZ6_NATA1|nr:ABC transporter substrate-binding protein [Natrialba asiatica]ELZ03523.1 Extracellular ligand-binding receptor [Natrialba asiatica DSM 12278]